ncbi:hypothetical protein LS48_13395 [Aequorivita aquimaris]|uniref:T9SS type A sorting domain-containing protein n=1 Tax=Aequorivita aquimaris TaxID=1548749 RepID=A0A137RF44_9FLAO|nr:T9SS type A sorting domain-containing protein [Aequorivita aquimaris]KXN98107.1 hypothetical protein LS48_13395 [Aequorivita aquimaris]
MKNLLLFSTLLLSTTGVFAQLTVKPTSGGADSYIYVNDEVVFVTQEINLTRNLSGPANIEASIYLRNNGQLIQGGTTSTNSGDGQLSVQQNSPVTNAFAYYYWCSPVGNSDGNTGSGNIPFGLGGIYEDINSVPGVGVAARRSSNISGRDGFTSPLTISRRWMYTHPDPGTEAEGNYIRINATNGAQAGYGFTMKGVNLNGNTPSGAPWGHDQIYEFRGRPNNGDITNIPVDGPVGTFPNTSAMMTLSGNPYPSALDMNKFYHDSANAVLGAIYYYDEDRSVMSHYYSQKPFGYGVWVPDGPDNTPDNPHDFLGTYTPAPFYIWNAGGGSTSHTGPGGGSDQNKRYAPIGQGFMLIGNSLGTVTIKNSHRVYIKEGAANHSVFQRPEGDSGSQINLPNDTGLSTAAETARENYRTPIMRIWSIFDEAVTRELALTFHEQATDGYDRGFDGLSPQDLKTDAYFPIGEDNNRKPYVINGIKYNPNKQVPIAFKIKNQSKLDLKVVEEVKKPYAHAYLYDRLENTYQQITGGMSATLNLPAGTYDNRFFIIFRNQNLRRDIPQTELNEKLIVMENVTFFQNNPLQQLEISNPEGYVIKSALVYDMNGKLVIQEKNLGDQSKYSFYTGNLSDGVYLVKLLTEDDIAIDYKAIVHNK